MCPFQLFSFRTSCTLTACSILASFRLPVESGRCSFWTESVMLLLSFPNRSIHTTPRNAEFKQSAPTSFVCYESIRDQDRTEIRLKFIQCSWNLSQFFPLFGQIHRKGRTAKPATVSRFLSVSGVVLLIEKFFYRKILLTSRKCWSSWKRNLNISPHMEQTHFCCNNLFLSLFTITSHIIITTVSK